MGQEIGQKTHLLYIDQNTPIDLHTNSCSYNIFMYVVGICFMRQYFGFLEYCHYIIYIHMHGYISTFKIIICCTLQDCNFKNSLGNI
jgi:hypothetical protein